MKTYILKLNSGVDYKLYDGATLVSDADLATLFATAGEGYFTFDFDSGTPSALTNFTISDSNDAVVITQASATVAEGPNYKGTWSASATAFDTFDKLGGVAMDEAELSFLMGETKKVEGASFIGSTVGQPSSLAYVGSANIQDGAVTTAKIADLNVTEGKLASNSVTTSKIADGSVTSDKIDWTTIERNCLSYIDRFTSDRSGTSIPLHSVNYTSKTGKVVIMAYAYVKTSRYTSFVRIKINNTVKTSGVTNSKTEYRLLTPIWCGDIGTSQVTISAEVAAQDSGTTAYTPQFQDYGLTIFDI